MRQWRSRGNVRAHEVAKACTADGRALQGSLLGPGRQGFALSSLHISITLLDASTITSTINLNTIYTCEFRMTPIF